MTRYFADHAWLGDDTAAADPPRSSPAGTVAGDHAESSPAGTVAANVLLDVSGERIVSVRSGVERPPEAVHLRGFTLPGLANAHSHAFHRALRGRTHRSGGSFWTWREDMYAVAERLDPDSYHALARAVYAEMALAGVTCVGEFHYLHHGPGGVPYADPNAMGEALIAAAGEAGIRITLLDACYLAGGFGEPLRGAQLRFGDGDALRWAERVSSLRPGPGARVGAAIHSVRAVPAPELSVVVEWARDAPLHFHVSEQRAENEACLAAHGVTPVALLAAHGALGPRSCAVHATHVTDADIALLAGTTTDVSRPDDVPSDLSGPDDVSPTGATGATAVCLCPTTERDLADGIGPARALAEAGAPLVVGSDSHAVIDLFEEARAVELDERLASERRGHFRTAELLRAATAGGHTALGWPEAGRLAEGAPADLVTVGLDSVRLAGARPDTLLESVVFAATAADVREVIVAGRPVVSAGRHLQIDDVPAALSAAIDAVLA